MTADADLQAKIAAIAGRINLHKNGQQPEQHCEPPRHYNNRYQQRWTPYAPAPAHSTTFQNRSLVIAPPISQDQDTNSGTTTPQTDAALVKTRGINNQLMTQSTYVREQQSKQAAVRPAKRQRTDSFRSKPATSRSIDIDGLKFEMKEDGSKLTRKNGSNDRVTPRRAVVAGVEFLRSKNGNLLRTVLSKDPTSSITPARPQCENFTKNGINYSTRWQSRTFRGLVRDHRCQLTLIGTCPFGPKCRFAHDPEKVAMCKSFLRKGSCPNGEYCDLSHKPTYHRVSACVHFQKDACNNESCRYPHVRATPGALVCRPFATLGYCDKGTECEQRHVFECPDYANTGICANLAKCPLAHTLRASRGRAHTDSDSEIDLVDDDADDLPADVDSDVEIFIADHSNGVQLTDNEDFVALS